MICNAFRKGKVYMIGIDPDPCDNVCKYMFVVDKQFIDHDEVKFPLYGAKFENGTIKPCPNNRCWL
jgi:hypothetical protein